MISDLESVFPRLLFSASELCGASQDSCFFILQEIKKRGLQFFRDRMILPAFLY